LLREEAALDARPRVGDDAELFESLRELRTDFARERGWAPYMVCGDAALRGMCRRRPHSLEELLDVPGIGEKKAADFGRAFLERIEEFEDQHLGEV
jgi:ATP-dependent DNA helicase RecQ